jgi:hypothetical protein
MFMAISRDCLPAKAGEDWQMKIYRVHVVGDTPPNLREVVSQIHAHSLLYSKNKDSLVETKVLTRRRRADLDRPPGQLDK